MDNVHGVTFLGWQVGPEGGNISESNGTLTFSGGDGSHLGSCLFKEFTPKGDFEVSFQLKAETLGEVLVDQAGEGFVFSFGSINMTSQQFRVVSLWLRARAGGQFLLAWHDKLCDLYGWQCNWEPFVYNGIGYNNGYDFWHPSPPQDRSNAPVKPDVWYTLKLKVHETPFLVTGEVYAENGTLLGSLTIDGMNDLTFKDIKYVYMSTGAGGTFYVRNITGVPVTPVTGLIPRFTYSPSAPKVFHETIFDASQSYPLDQVVLYSWDFGDGNFTSTQQTVISHVYATSGMFNVTLTTTDSAGLNASTFQIIHVQSSTSPKYSSYLSISTDSSFSVVGSIVNVNGRLYDHDGNGLVDEPVVLYYTFPGISSWFPVSSCFTNGTGNYDIQWVNPASGTFTLRTEWGGNETYAGANATTTLSSLPYQNLNVFFVESNSTVTSLAFNSTNSELSFTVSGPSGTTGYVKATIAKTLMANAENLKVYLDGNQLTSSLTETANSWLLTFSYTHSSHRLSVYLPPNVALSGDNETRVLTDENPVPLASVGDDATLAPAINTATSGIDYTPCITIVAVASLVTTAIVISIVLRRRTPA